VSFLNTSDPDFYGVAWNEEVSPPVCVIAGELGTILYSTGRQYTDGFQVYSLEQANNPTYNVVYGVAFGNSLFMAACSGGLILTSEDGAGWNARDTGVSLDLRAVTHVTGDIWVAVGLEGKIARTTDNGLTWADITHPGGWAYYGIAYNSGTLVVVGGSGEAMVSTDDGLTWTLGTTNVTSDLRGIVYGPDGFYIVGAESTLLKTTDGLAFTVLSSPSVADFNAIAYTGTGGIMAAVGDDGATITSTEGATWDEQDSGIPEANFYGIGYGDNRLVTVGSESLVAYSATGAGRPAFDLFQPISDKYRAQCFTQQDAYMMYFGMLEFEEGKWNYYPRRMRCPAPGTVDDFETVGHYFTDFPGNGAVLDAISIRGGVVTAETDQLGLVTDGGSLSLPWIYQQNYGEGLKPVSNLASFNGVAYVVGDDGLIYSATSTGVARLQGFFDLSRFEDWDAADEAVWLQFDPIYQLLFVFRQKSPWTIWLVNDDSGGVSEIDLPEITINGVAYEPRSAFIIKGLHDGIHCGYAPSTGSDDELVTVKLDLDGPILGVDEVSSGDVKRYYGEIATGSFRVTAIGLRGSAEEVLVRTWADPDSTVRPDVAVMIREETEDEWETNDQPHGDITVYTDRVEGVGTAFSRYLQRGLTERVIEMTTPKVAVRPHNMRVIHNFIQMTVPKVGARPFDMLVNHEGQTNIKITTPKVAVRPFDMEITHDKPIGMTTPKVAVRPFDMNVHRDGYYVLPWLVDQCKVYVEQIGGTRALAPFTKVGKFELELTTPLNPYESLYINPGAVRPFVLGRVGDYILTQYGAHRISAVNTAYQVELDWYPPAECSGTYVPAQAIPAGGAEGDGKIVVGLGRGFDQIMLRVLLLPHAGCDATGAKITGLELGEMDTGPELKTDAGG
jgi:photosystem II stability/assembly factor-like uncharacterized protein